MVEEEELETAKDDVQEEKKEEQTEPEPEPDLPFAVEIASFMALDFDLRDTNGMQPARNPASIRLKLLNESALLQQCVERLFGWLISWATAPLA